LIAVGGGLGVLPEMQRQVVTRYGWVTTREFVDGYTLAQLTPGPNMLVAIFVGYRAHGLVGALVAGTAMFVPTSSLTGLIARRWERLRRRPWALATERALAPVGIGPMAAGVYTLARSAVHGWVTAAPLPEGLTPEEKRDIEVFRRAQASVVFITSVALRRDIFSFDVQQIPQGTGSGIVWDRQGHIVTNFHVIQDGNAFAVTLADQS